MFVPNPTFSKNVTALNDEDMDSVFSLKEFGEMIVQGILTPDDGDAYLSNGDMFGDKWDWATSPSLEVTHIYWACK